MSELDDVLHLEPREGEDAPDRDELRLRERERRRRADIRELMSSAGGRRWVHGLLEFTGLFRSSFTGELSWTAFNEGQRNVGLRVYAEINDVCPELYGVMREEMASEGGAC